MEWDECQRHNLRYYKQEVFIMSKFDPRTRGDWYKLLQKRNRIPINL